MARVLTCLRTEQGTEGRRSGRARCRVGSGAAWAAPLLALALALCPGFGAGSARGADDGVVLEGSGIRYPAGFDQNTVGEIRGTAHGIERPEHGPVRFRLDSGGETYVVLASPEWYWEDLRTEIADGVEVTVRGSKTLGRDMVLYVIAQEIRIAPSGRAWVFRDDRGFPLWKSAGNGMGPGGGSGSPMLRGGAGGGGGMGMGGRRR
jgi:hypothetical protein